MRRFASCAALLALSLLATILLYSPAAKGIARHKCVNDLNLSATQVEEASARFPLVAVHGYRNAPDAWQGKHSLEGILKSLKGISTFLFNYEKANTRWVTDSEIAPRLTQYIACYSILSKRPVILLTHSMGGLAAREALDSAAYGLHIKNVVGHIITIGTPHKGSAHADIASSFWQTVCKGVIFEALDSACRVINSVKATAGMKLNSRQLAQLAHFPPGISVKAIAGEASLRSCLPWGCSPSTSTGGDLVVPVESATAEYTAFGRGDGKKVFTCDADTLMSPFSDAWCEHNNMLRAPQVQAEVRRSITDYLSFTNQPATDLFGLKLRLGKNWQVSDELSTPELKVVINTAQCSPDLPPAYCPQFTVANLTALGQDWKPYKPADPASGIPASCGASRFHDDTYYQLQPKAAGVLMIGGEKIPHSKFMPCPGYGTGETGHAWLAPQHGILIYDHDHGVDKPLAGLEQLLTNGRWQ